MAAEALPAASIRSRKDGGQVVAEAMSDEMMSLRALIEKAPDTEFLREMIGFAAIGRLPDPQAGGQRS